MKREIIICDKNYINAENFLLELNNVKITDPEILKAVKDASYRPSFSLRSFGCIEHKNPDEIKKLKRIAFLHSLEFPLYDEHDLKEWEDKTYYKPQNED